MGKLWETGLAFLCCTVCLALVTDALDCRRFVFAPMCRGISAKRSVPSMDDDFSREDRLPDRNQWVHREPTSLRMLSGFPLSSHGLAGRMMKELLGKYRDLGRREEEEEESDR